MIKIGIRQFVAAKSKGLEVADGCYRVFPHGITFYANNDAPRVHLVANRYGERFFVSCGHDSSGAMIYMHGLSSVDEKFLGIDNWKYSEQIDLAESIWKQINNIIK